MSAPKRSNTKQPFDNQQDLEELYPVDVDTLNDPMTNWKDVDRQLEEGMGELDNQCAFLEEARGL